MSVWPLECFLHIEFYSKIRDIFRLLIHCILFSDFWTFFPCISTVIITQVSVWPLEFSSIEISSLGFATIFSFFSLFSFFLFSSFYPFRHVLLFIFLSILFRTFFPCIPTVINTPIEISSLLVAIFLSLLFILLPFFFFLSFSSLSFSSCPFIYFPFDLFSSVLLSFPCFLNFFFLILCLDQCVVFLSYNSRVCSYEFAS